MLVIDLFIQVGSIISRWSVWYTNKSGTVFDAQISYLMLNVLCV